MSTPLGRRYNVLCLSGGGYRGLFTASFLEKLQNQYPDTPLNRMFDLIIGTSTGSLVAAGIALGNHPRVIRKAFEEHGPTIFPQNRWRLYHWQRLLRFRALYQKEPLVEAIKSIVGDTMADTSVSEIDAPLAIVALSRVNLRHRVFLGKPLAEPGERSVHLSTALCASTAAPSYFPEVHLQAHQNNRIVPTDRLIDGGLVANAPVLLGPTILKKRFGVPVDQVFVLHVGTAGASKSQGFALEEQASIKDKLLLKLWRRRAIDMTRNLVQLTMAAQESFAIELAETWLGEKYVQIDADGDNKQVEELASLDNAGVIATGMLLNLAEQAWRKWSADHRLKGFFPIPEPF